MTPGQRGKYSRQILFAPIGAEGQERLLVSSVVFMLSLVLLINLFGQESASEIVRNQPPEVVSCLEKKPSLTVDSTMNPFYLKGDFDGNGTLDHAVAVVDLDKRYGILFCFLDRGPLVHGAGNKSSGQTDFRFDAWYVVSKRDFRKQGAKRKGEAIHIKWTESGSGLLSIQGGKLVWQQLED